MNIRWLRVITAGVIAEILPIVVLVMIVAIFGPREQGGAEEFAVRLGTYVGPIGGAVFAFLMAIWAARGAKIGYLLHGTLVGLFAALLDASILVASSAEFQFLFVISGVGRILGGFFGGYLVARNRLASSEETPAEEDSEGNREDKRP